MNLLLWEGPLSDLGHLRDAYLQGIVPSEIGVVSFPDGRAQFFMSERNEDIKRNFLLYYGKWANAKAYYVPRGLPFNRITDVCKYIDPSLSVSLTSYLGYYLVCSTTYLPEELKILFEEGYFIHRLPLNRGILYAFAASLCTEAFDYRYQIFYRNAAIYVGDCSREIFVRIIEKYQEILNDVITSECQFTKIDGENAPAYNYKIFSYKDVLYATVPKGESLIIGDKDSIREEMRKDLIQRDYLDWKIIDGLSLTQLADYYQKEKVRTFDIQLYKEESNSFSNVIVYYYTTTKGSKVPVVRIVGSTSDNIEQLFSEGHFFSNLFKNMYEDYSVVIEEDPIRVIDRLKGTSD